MTLISFTLPSPPASPKPHSSHSSISSQSSSSSSTSSRRRPYSTSRVIPSLRRHETMLNNNNQSVVPPSPPQQYGRMEQVDLARRLRDEVESRSSQQDTLSMLLMSDEDEEDGFDSQGSDRSRASG